MSALIATQSADPLTRGLDYLYGTRSLALEPEMINLLATDEQRATICIWIGTHIEAVNAHLQGCLQACHACFHPWAQPPLQIVAVPLAPAYGLAACCNFQTTPYTLLVDVGRVLPPHWVRLVAHEYAHAQAGSPGHHAEFIQALTHLCLGLNWPAPPAAEAALRSHPPCLPSPDPLAFWRGEYPDWAASVKNSYFLSS